MVSHEDEEVALRRARLLELVFSGPPVDSATRLARVCEVAIDEVGVDGGAVVLMTNVPDGLAGLRTVVGSAGDLAEVLEGLQLTTGEGPCLEAVATGAPVLVADLGTEQGRWPGFAPEAAESGAGAVFSFPLQVGVVCLGTFDLYRRQPGPVHRSGFANALVLGEFAIETLLDESGRPEFGWLPDVHAVVHQASGMISAATGIPIGDALVRLRAHAFVRSVAIDEVARRIVARDLVLDDPPPP